MQKRSLDEGPSWVPWAVRIPRLAATCSLIKRFVALPHRRGPQRGFSLQGPMMRFGFNRCMRLIAFRPQDSATTLHLSPNVSPACSQPHQPPLLAADAWCSCSSKPREDMAAEHATPKDSHTSRKA